MGISQRISLYIHPLDLSVQTDRGQTVRHALQEHGVYVDSPCDGQGVCGRCKIRVQPSKAVAKTPHANISEAEAQTGVRLACQAVVQQDVQVFLPPTYRLDAQATHLDGPVLVGAGSRSAGQVHPAVQIVERAGTYRFIHEEAPGQKHLLADWGPEITPKGLALDVGTTTLAASLVCLSSGRELASAGQLNPQVTYGHDVLTRIQRASSPEGLELLATTVHRAASDLIQEVCAQAGSHQEHILDAVIGGNTTMVQICAGEDPAPLGRLPFSVGLKSGCSYPARKLGLQIHPQAMVYIPPIVHAFVGSDISAGLIAIKDFFHAQSKLLFLDVGTNGEMGVSTGYTRMLTSTAAGPAFEGSGLSGGMRAAPGAIQAVSFDGRDLKMQIIGSLVEPRGICGSGLLDLVHTLLETGVIDPSGRLLSGKDLPGCPSPLADRVQELEGAPAVKLGPKVWLTQADIRQVQLAKGAMRTGIDFLLDKAGLHSQELQKVVIGGGFGNVLRPASLEGIGMLPPGTGEKVIFAGNTSQLGCTYLLLSSPLRRQLEEDMAQVEHVGLAQDTDFMDVFVQNMEFPQPELCTRNHSLVGQG